MPPKPPRRWAAGTRSVIAEDVPDAVLEEPGDVVVRVTSGAICGTDPHMYDAVR
jgi:glutathione-independent formaldehyde dehydrogenase